MEEMAEEQGHSVMGMVLVAVAVVLQLPQQTVLSVNREVQPTEELEVLAKGMVVGVPITELMMME
jgi:hypothetical protein